MGIPPAERVQHAGSYERGDTASPFSFHQEQDPNLGRIGYLEYKDPLSEQDNKRVAFALDRGFTVIEFSVGGVDLIYADKEALANPQKPLDYWTGIFWLAMLNNRHKGPDGSKSWTNEEQVFSLEDAPEPVPGDRYLNHGDVWNKSWHEEGVKVKKDGISFTAFLDHTPQSPSFRAFPFKHRLSITLTLNKNGLDIEPQIKNQEKKEMWYLFGPHPYWKNDEGSEVRIPAKSVFEMGDDLVPTGRILPLTGGRMYQMLDLNTYKEIDGLELDHGYILKPGESPSIRHKNGLQIDMVGTQEFNTVVIYTPPSEEAQGSPKKPFVCVENVQPTNAYWGYLQALKREDTHMQKVMKPIIIPPESTYTKAKISYTVSRGNFEKTN